MSTEQQTIPVDEREAQRTEIVKSINALSEHIDHLDQQRSSLRAQLRDLGGGPAGAWTVQVQPNRRFSPDLAAQHVPADVLAGCFKTTLDSQAVKANVAPAVYDQCMAEVGDPKVVIR